MTNLPAKEVVVGTPISRTSFSEVSQLMQVPRQDRALVIAVSNVHSVMSARRDPQLARALREADIATPDGMPLVWGLRALGHDQQERVYGPDLMRHVLVNDDGSQRHFLFGSTPETLARLESAVSDLNPQARIVGKLSPPFRPLTAAENEQIVKEIRISNATVTWVGLGMPKQELWMHQVREMLPGVTLLGVGAAFDFLAGVKRQAPPWMQNAGLEWLFRLSQEPRRLWRRYLWNNPAYLVLLARQVVGTRVQLVRKRTLPVNSQR